MCDFGSPESRYDINLAGPDTLYARFFSRENAAYLRAEFTRLGYPELRMSQLHPFMAEVYGTTAYTGFNPGASRRHIPISRLNRHLIQYMIPIFENNKMARRSYILDQKYGLGRSMPDPPMSDNCRTRSLLYNNRFPNIPDQ